MINVFENNNIDLTSFKKMSSSKMRKIQFMLTQKPVITIISFMINKPLYRKNSTNGLFISDTLIKIKTKIRNEIGLKLHNYFSDIVCHTGDNPQMNREILDVVKKYRSD